MVSLEEFFIGLRDVAVLPQAEFLRLRAEVPADGDEASVVRLAKELVDDGRLTPYQRDLLLQGRWRELCAGEYLLLEPIGRGGMGQVFLALHRHMHRRVALKQLRPDVAGLDEVTQRFQREIKTIARLSHPNVVTAYDAGEDHGMLYLVMEYVEGETLHELVKRDGRRSVAEAIEYVVQAARGLRRSTRPTSSTATSSRPTCCGIVRAPSRSSTWGSHASRGRRVGSRRIAPSVR